MEIHLTGETISHVEETKTRPEGFQLKVTFRGFESIDQCKKFLARLDDVALATSGQTKLEDAEQ